MNRTEQHLVMNQWSAMISLHRVALAQLAQNLNQGETQYHYQVASITFDNVNPQKSTA